MVRLEFKKASNLFWIERVSIPYGAIRIVLGVELIWDLFPFQFLMVRLEYGKL